MDAQTQKKEKKDSLARSEELRFDSVVAVNPGHYEVALTGDDGEMKAKTNLVALDHESYVVLRTGVEAQQGPKYDQELVVFPQSDPAMLHGGASKVSTSFLAAMLAAA